MFVSYTVTALEATKLTLFDRFWQVHWHLHISLSNIEGRLGGGGWKQNGGNKESFAARPQFFDFHYFSFGSFRFFHSVFCFKTPIGWERTIMCNHTCSSSVRKILSYLVNFFKFWSPPNLVPRGCIPFGQNQGCKRYFDPADRKCARALGTRLITIDHLLGWLWMWTCSVISNKHKPILLPWNWK